jgi:hypothetical protein
VAGEPGSQAEAGAWRLAVMHALPVAALVLGLQYTWFVVADRHIVFLYDHDMGPLYPDTSPFSRVTSSRYWMTGLVAGGVVMLLYGAANWLLGRVASGYRPPAWWRVWAICAALLLIGIPAITMTVNKPTLPPLNAAQVTLVTLMGLALALMPGRLAAEAPGELLWLGADGLGLMLVLLNLTHVEDLPRWLARGGTWWVRSMAVGLALGAASVPVVAWLRSWRRQSVPRAAAVLAAGLCEAYLLMPLVHHILGTDGYYYISDSDNFFAKSGTIQVVTWLVAAGMALGSNRLGSTLAARRARVGNG